jgi:hypothetical protein
MNTAVTDEGETVIAADAVPHHETTVNVDPWPDEVTVPSFGPRLRCTKCGALGSNAIPNWIEAQDRLPGTRR